MKDHETQENAAHGGTCAAVGSASDAAQEVIDWAKAVLTALNTGGIEQNSLLHLKLRDVIIKHRDAVERETPNKELSGKSTGERG